MKDARGFVPVAIAVALALGGLHFLVQPDPSRRNWELFPDMVESVAAESFSANELLPNGVTQQPPQPGVVVRGTQAFDFGVGPEEAARAGRELTNPYDVSDANVLERGALVYAAFCTVCHDAQGGGAGPVVARGMLPPPSLSGARAMAMADGEMFHILTRGQGNMASYAAQLTPDDRWRAIAWVRRLQQESAR